MIFPSNAPAKAKHELIENALAVAGFVVRVNRGLLSSSVYAPDGKTLLGKLERHELRLAGAEDSACSVQADHVERLCGVLLKHLAEVKTIVDAGGAS